MGGVGISSRLRRAAKKMAIGACGSFSRRRGLDDLAAIDVAVSSSSVVSPTKRENNMDEANSTNSTIKKTNITSKQNLCTICLDPLNYGKCSSPGQAIFTAQCSHVFHFTCISSNVRHGSVTCPICRAQWTQLPRNLNPPLFCNQNDPILRILDDSIATFRVHRRSFLRSACYDDDDPIESGQMPNHSLIDLSLIPISPAHHSFDPYGSLHHFTSSSSLTLTGHIPYMCSPPKAYLSVKLAPQRAIDLVLVASSNGPHIRLLKQSMALLVCSLRPIDRLAIVTYSSAAARVFPLRRMTSYGKRAAIEVIDNLFYMGQADPIEGLKKGIKILEDRTYKNQQFCILHLSDTPATYCHPIPSEDPIPIHWFHVGFGFGTSNGFVIHEFEEFLARLLGCILRDIQLRIDSTDRIIRLGELRAGEERRILLEPDECDHVRVGYSYIDGGFDECYRTGEAMLSTGEKNEQTADGSALVGHRTSIGGRTSNAENWDYYDPYMARRWAKHLHGYRR